MMVSRSLRAAALFIVSASLLFSSYGYAEDSVIVRYMEGSVTVLANGASSWTNAEVSKKIYGGDRIKTGPASRCDISYEAANKSLVGISENSDVIVFPIGGEQIELIDGHIYSRISGLRSGSTFKVKTPLATCGVRGTGFGVDFTGGKTRLMVFNNEVYLENPEGGKVLVIEGYERTSDSKGRISDQAEVPEAEKRKYNDWENTLFMNFLNLRRTKETISKVAKEREEDVKDLEDILGK